MHHNILFNFIQKHAVGRHFSHRGIPLVLSETTECTHYYRAELPCLEPIKIADTEETYILTAHHVSIYEHEHASNPFLSQYHYTAYFRDPSGVSYQLHVYYNEKDQLTISPQFAKSDGTGGWIIVEMPNFALIFTELGHRYASQLIFNLRQDLIQHVHALEIEYQGYNAEAERLSVAWQSDYEAYKTASANCVRVLEQLIPLVKQDYYRKVHNFILRVQAELEKTYQRLSTAAPLAETEIAKPDEVSVEKSGEASAKQSGEAGSRASADGAVIAALQARFNAMAPDNPGAAELANLFSEISGLMLSLEEGDATLETIFLLQKLYQDVYNKMNRSFIEYLIGVDMTSLNQLSQFSCFIKEQHLAFALQRGKHELLDFLLTHGEFSVHHPVKIRGVTYASLVQACFHLDTETTPMVDCLTVLICHGATGLEEDTTGLPIADLILSTPSHRLLPALVANSAVTLYSPGFCKALIIKLRDCLRLPGVDQTAISLRIAAYHTQKDLSKSFSVAAGMTPEAVVAASSTAMTVAAAIPTTWVGKMSDNTEILSAIKVLNQAFMEFKRVVAPGKMARRLEHLMTQSFDDVNSIFQSGQLRFNAQASYATVYQSALTYVGNLTQFFNKLGALIALEKDIARGIHAFGVTQYQALIKRRDSVKEQVEDLEYKCFQQVDSDLLEGSDDSGVALEDTSETSDTLALEGAVVLEHPTVATRWLSSMVAQYEDMIKRWENLEQQYVLTLSEEEQEQYAKKCDALWTHDVFLNVMGESKAAKNPSPELEKTMMSMAHLILENRLALVQHRIKVIQSERRLQELSSPTFFKAGGHMTSPKEPQRLQRELRKSRNRVADLETAKFLQKTSFAKAMDAVIFEQKMGLRC